MIPQIPEWLFFVSVVHFNFQVLLVVTVFIIFIIDILEPYKVIISLFFRCRKLDEMVVYFNQKHNLPLDARSWCRNGYCSCSLFSNIFLLLISLKILSDLFHFVRYLVQYLPVVKFMGRRLVIVCLLKVKCRSTSRKLQSDNCMQHVRIIYQL